MSDFQDYCDFIYNDTQNETIYKINSDKPILYVPSTVKNISKDVLLGNTHVQYLYFEENSQLSFLEEAAFNQSSLISISFKNCTLLTKLPSFCFNESRSLTSCIFPDNLKELSYGCFRLTSLQHVVFPDSLEKIESSNYNYHATFHECYNLTSVSFSFNSNLSILPQRVFWYCKSLKEVILPPSIKTIKEGVFGGCSSLQSIYILSDSCYVENTLFGNALNKIVHVYVLNTGVMKEFEKYDQNLLQIHLLTKEKTATECSSFRNHLNILLLTIFL